MMCERGGEWRGGNAGVQKGTALTGWQRTNNMHTKHHSLQSCWGVVRATHLLWLMCAVAQTYTTRNMMTKAA